MSCDPMRRIAMKNNTHDEIEITWTIKEDSILNSPFYLSSSTKTTFKLLPEKPYDFVNMSCGVGTWTPQALQDITDDLESLVIKWKDREIRLDTDEELKSFLFPRRRGFERDRIKIIVTEMTAVE
jgi:hypothetical protein